MSHLVLDIQNNLYTDAFIFKVALARSSNNVRVAFLNRPHSFIAPQSSNKKNRDALSEKKIRCEMMLLLCLFPLHHTRIKTKKNILITHSVFMNAGFCLGKGAAPCCASVPRRGQLISQQMLPKIKPKARFIVAV